jgi:hypothetical protein
MQRRTALINEIRGLLLERDLTFAARPIYLVQEPTNRD